MQDKKQELAEAEAAYLAFLPEPKPLTREYLEARNAAYDKCHQLRKQIYDLHTMS